MNSFFLDLEQKTKKIADFLATNKEFDIKEIQILADLYNERKESIKKLDEWYNSEEGKKFIKDNADEWDNKLAQLLKTDNEQVKKIDERVRNINKKLRNLTKRRSVLLYTKEK
jgi:DNA-binding transcriptional MerR regulator